MTLRLAAGAVTVLLGPSVARRRLMNRLDDDGGRCADGHRAGVLRVRARDGASLSERLDAVAAAGGGATTILLADRLTDGLPAGDRSAVLRALRATARDGTTVLVDDVDPVAALAAADSALRVDEHGGVRAEPVSEPYYRAS